MNRVIRTLRSIAKRPILLNVTLAVVHILAARLGLLLSHPETHITMVWPPSGIALAAVLLFGYDVFPGLFVGDAVVAILENHPPLVWVIGPLGNTLGAVGGAWLLREYVDFDLRLRRLRDVLWLALIGGLVGTFVSATLGVGVLVTTGRIATADTLSALLTWWLGDTVGVTVFAPALLVVGNRLRETLPFPKLDVRRIACAALPFLVLAATCAVVFGGLGLLFPRRAGLPLAFAVFPPLVWIAARFGLPGSSLAILLTTLLGVVGTALGRGPFSGPDVAQNLGVLWSFVGVMAFTTLTLGATVSARRRAEEELGVRRQLWDSLMANTPDLVYFKDADHGVIRASQAYADAVGVPASQLMGKTAAELWPREAEEIMADERAVLAGNPMIKKERAATNAAGERRWYLLTKVPIYQDGQVIGFFAIDKDITERKEVEERLAFQSMLLDQIQDMVVATDLEGTITYVNQAECRAFERTADEFIGQSIETLGEDPARGGTQREILATTLAEGSWRGEVINFAPDGREIILDARVQLVHDEEGQPVGIVGVSTDVTDQKALQLQLRRHERLAAVGQLAAGIAHDFRNLLTTIILYAGLPLRRSDLPSGLEQSLHTIVTEAEKATDLVQQILDFSSSSMIERRPLDLETLASDVLDVLRRTIPETVRITLKAGPGPYIVEADPGRLQQALTNLALNARDAMPGGGELRISLARMELGPSDQPPVADMNHGAWVCMTVSDTGTGMTPEVQQHLFEPFFTTKEVGEGTGLGLAQVYGIIRQHRGAIDVQTEPGDGTAFHIYLPASSRGSGASEGTPPPSRAEPPHGRGETILLVEDEEKVRAATERMLTNLGYTVLTAKNGREALALCQAPRWTQDENPIDLVIADVIMPEMGGRELLNALRRGSRSVRAIAITGYALQEGEVEDLKSLGFARVVRKPFEVDDLASTVREVLDP